MMFGQLIVLIQVVYITVKSVNSEQCMLICLLSKF